jgi:hypothetical protein
LNKILTDKMKTTLIIFSAAVMASMALQSCNQPKVDTAREWASIDSMANLRVVAYRDSLQMSCMNNIMAMAKMKSDSMMTAAMSKGGKPKPKPAPKPDNSTPTVTNRPGTTNPTSVSDRPGSSNASGEKPTITNRPGATKSDTIKKK